jgi:hypothetical protein
MREQARIHRIIKKLEKLWLQCPDQRLGQVLLNYIFDKGKKGDQTDLKIFYQEDTETEMKLNVYVEGNN